jgi:aminopeptidase C
VSRGLSAEQAELMKEAINNQRKLDEIIDELREASQKLIFAVLRKSLSSKPAKRPKPRLS